jgi:hypothetical protein
MSDSDSDSYSASEFDYKYGYFMSNLTELCEMKFRKVFRLLQVYLRTQNYWKVSMLIKVSFAKLAALKFQEAFKNEVTKTYFQKECMVHHIECFGDEISEICSGVY